MKVSVHPFIIGILLICGSLGCTITEPARHDVIPIDLTPGAHYVWIIPQELIGGERQLQQQVDQSIARNAGLEGQVLVQFVIDTDGVPGEVEVLESLCPLCDEEAMRLVSEARYKPAREGATNEPVRVRETISISFAP